MVVMVRSLWPRTRIRKSSPERFKRLANMAAEVRLSLAATGNQ
jgi:hypothetical protein